MSVQETAGGEARADHSSFAEHLRIVHFTLCLTCFITIIAVSAKSSSSAQRAYDQGNLLLRLQAVWDNGKWLDEVADKRGAPSRAFEAKVEARNYSRSFDFRPAGQATRQWERYRWLAFARKDKDKFIALKPNVSRSFSNLEDAESVWNMLGEHQYVITPSSVRNGWMMKPSDNPQDNFAVEATLNGGAPVAISSGRTSPTADVIGARWFLESGVEEYMTFEGEPFREAAIEIMKKKKEPCYFVAIARENRGPNVRPGALEGMLMLPADCTTEKISLRQMLGNSILPVGFPFEDFKRSFPDVSDLGKNLKSLSLTELRDFFQAEQDRSSDKVELPLVKLPAESVAYWGTATIFLLATYWFAVFRDFSLRAKLDDKAWDVPWIGTSRERWSQGLFLATTLLPCGTAFYVIFYGLGRSFAWEGRLSLAITAFILIGLPVLGVLLSWRKLQHPG